MSALLLTGPAVAVIGIVAVFFVMRHKSVEKRSMYSSRRSQIEHKVRAARQRTLVPLKRGEKASRAGEDEGASAPAPTMTYEAPAYAGPPVAPPPLPSHVAHAQPAWDAGPTTPAPRTPTFTPPAPAYEPPPAEPPPSETPEAQQAWTPAPETPEPAPRERPAPAQTAAATPAGGGASWSVVGETKGTAEPEPVAKKKKSKDEARTGAWALASGEVAGEEGDDSPKQPSAALAVAQYAALVLGLCLVLIGVVVMVANQTGT